MKIVGVMLARNEDWVIGWSARAALKWVDTLVVYMHGCRDQTWPILRKIQQEHPGRLVAFGGGVSKFWHEMEARQKTLLAAREHRATHVAIIDADEVPTANMFGQLRLLFSDLKPGQILNLPMIAPWRSLREFRHDSSIWSGAQITLGFADTPDLTWRPAADGYDHHHRAPYGIMPPSHDPFNGHDHGGVMHLQWVWWRRMQAKHAWYKITERLRWPQRDDIDRKYNLASDEQGIGLKPLPAEWLDGLERHLNLLGNPWQEVEAKRLYIENPGRFDDLNLFGVCP